MRFLAGLAALVLFPFAEVCAGEPLRVGTSGDYPPFSSIGAGDARSGFDIELSRLLGTSLQRSPEFIGFRWPELGERSRDGAFDLVASGVTVRPDRALFGRFTRPYAISEAVVLIRAADAPKLVSLAALDRPEHSIAVNRGGYLEGVAHAHLAKTRIEPVDDNLDLADPLIAGKVDALVTDSIEEREIRRVHPELVRLAALTRDRKALFVPAPASAAGARELHAAADTWLGGHNGEVNRLQKEWLGEASVLGADEAHAEAIVALIDQRLGLMPWVAAFKRAAKQPIADEAREREVLQRTRESARAAGLPEEPTVALFAVLIEAAKDIQRAASPLEPTVDLATLRRVLSELDARLIAELAASQGIVAAARARLADGIRAMNWPGLGEARKNEIAAAVPLQ